MMDIAMERRLQDHRQIQTPGPSGHATLAVRPKILGNPVMVRKVEVLFVVIF